MKLPSNMNVIKGSSIAIVVASLLSGCASTYKSKVDRTLNFQPLSKAVKTEYQNIKVTKVSDEEFQVIGKPGTYVILTKGALENGCVSNKPIIEENNDNYGSSAITSNQPYKMVQIPESGNTILEIDGYKVMVKAKK